MEEGTAKKPWDQMKYGGEEQDLKVIVRGDNDRSHEQWAGIRVSKNHRNQWKKESEAAVAVAWSSGHWSH
jgi:hypothetical protein